MSDNPYSIDSLTKRTAELERSKSEDRSSDSRALKEDIKKALSKIREELQTPDLSPSHQMNLEEQRDKLRILMKRIIRWEHQHNPTFDVR